VKNISTIAFNTFREAVRDKVFYNLVIFSLIVLASSKILGMVSAQQDVKIIMDAGMASISIFGLIIAIFIGSNLVHKEIDKSTILTIIVKPVERFEYILGKYFGLLLTIFVNLVLMSGGFFILLKISTGTWKFFLIDGIILIFIELIVMSAIGIMFSCFTTPLLGVVLSICCYVMGHLVEDFIFISEKLNDASIKWICNGIFYILPNLEYFNIKNELIHEITVSNSYMISTAVYGISYSAAVMCLAILVFRMRNFK
jgi:ABC-type transport system involved in multi-copper enzyme maturation permease subunit